MESLTMHQSGPMCERSMDLAGMESWISSLRVSPVSPSQQREAGREIVTNATSGLRRRDLLARFDPVSCSWKMFSDSFSGMEMSKHTLTRSLRSLPRWVTWDTQGLYRLETSERPTNENESGSLQWRTPAQQESGINPERNVRQENGASSPIWPHTTGADDGLAYPASLRSAHQEVGRLEQPDSDGRGVDDANRCAGRGEDTDRRHLQAWSQDPGLPVVNSDIGCAYPFEEICSGRDAPFPPSPADTDAWARVLERYPDLAPATTKAESPLCDMVDGVPQRMAMLKALGNAIVSQSAAKFLRTHGKGP